MGPNAGVVALGGVRAFDPGGTGYEVLRQPYANEQRGGPREGREGPNLPEGHGPGRAPGPARTQATPR
ncbi:hypothetical protein ACWGHM_15725 [Streptomyces sp. NPDC054904]